MKSMSRLAVVVCVSLVTASPALAWPEFVLPDVLFAAPGVECNVYYDGAFETVTPWRYAYEAECPVGWCERFRWHWTPAAEDAGRSVPLVLRALDDDGTVAEKSVTVRVARLPKAPDTRRITLAMLGASISNSGYPQRVMKLMRENGYPNYTPVGSHAGGGKPVVPGGIAYDGYGGFQWGDFLRRWWARECELPQEQMKAEEEALRLGQREFVIQQGDAYRLKSPLLRVGASGRPELDLQGWLDRINGGKPPDVITVALFGNDMFKARPGTLQAHLDRTFADVEKLLSVLRAAAPKAHIGIGLGVAAADQDAFAKNYGCLQSAAQYRRNIFAFNRRMMAFDFIRRDGNMSLIPMNAAIDTVSSFPRAEVAAHADTTQTVWRTSNALHPLRCGGDQLGDAIFAWLADVLSRDPAERKVSVAECGAIPSAR